MATSFIIKYNQSFKAIRIIDNELIPTHISVSADLIGNSSIDSLEFRLGIAKLDFWFSQVINHSIMFACDNKWALEFLLEQSANMPLILPYEPTDDVLATVFNTKCNALSGGAFDVGLFTVEDEDSSLTFTFADEEATELPGFNDWFPDGRSFYKLPWWHRGDSSSFDVLPAEDDDLSKEPECFFSLDFLKERFIGPAEIIRPNFKPEIIPGKKK